MAGTFTNLNYHIIFSAKERRPAIIPEIQTRLYDYMGGIIKNDRGVLETIGGTSDHVHLLLRWRPDESISKLLQILKSRSSGWVHQTFPQCGAFQWQEGYAAFSVSESQCEKVRRYIQNQDEHHRKIDFKEELRELLRAHGVQFDEKFIWV